MVPCRDAGANLFGTGISCQVRHRAPGEGAESFALDIRSHGIQVPVARAIREYFRHEESENALRVADAIKLLPRMVETARHPVSVPLVADMGVKARVDVKTFVLEGMPSDLLYDGKIQTFGTRNS